MKFRRGDCAVGDCASGAEMFLRSWCSAECRCRGSKEQVQTWCRRSGAEVVKRWCRGSAEQQQSRNRAWCATVHGVLVLQRCRGAGGAGAVEMLQRCCRGAAEVLHRC